MVMYHVTASGKLLSARDRTVTERTRGSKTRIGGREDDAVARRGNIVKKKHESVSWLPPGYLLVSWCPFVPLVHAD